MKSWLILLLLAGPLWGATPEGSQGFPVKVAFLGDQGRGDEPRAVLRLVKAEGADMILHQGDFDYEDDPDAWDRMLDDVLGPGFPVFAALGNHDVKARQGYVKKLAARLARVPGASCQGVIADRAACRYRGLFFVSLAAGMGGGRRDADYIRERLAEDDSLWRICSWHIPKLEMQVGEPEDEVGWDIYEECRKGGAIVATAHEHSYSRTHLMEDFSRQRVASTGSPLRLEKGKTFAFVSGLGGHSVRSQKRKGHWWAAVYTKTQGADFGALFCTFGSPTPEKASCYFKDVAGNVPDRFEVVSGLAEPAGNRAKAKAAAPR